MYDPTALTGQLVRLTATWDGGYRHVAITPVVPSQTNQLSLPTADPSPDLIGAVAYGVIEEPTVTPRARFEGDEHWEEEVLLVAPLCLLCLPSRGVTYAAGIGFRSRGAACELVLVCSRHHDVQPRVDVDRLSRWVDRRVLWGALHDSHVRDLMAISDHLRGIQHEPALRRRYANELARGESASVFAEHLRVDAGGDLWLPVWSRLVTGQTGTDVPVSRTDDGALEVDLTDVRLKRPIRRLTDRDVETGFTLETTRVGGDPIAPAGRAEFDLPKPDIAV